MVSEGIATFLNFVVSTPDQPQKYLAFAGAVLLGNVVLAVLDWKWGRGIGFTAVALLAGAYFVYVLVIMLHGTKVDLELELTDPQSWASFGVNISIVFWYFFELPLLVGLGIGAVVLSALARQRGWIVGNAVALGLTVVAPLLLVWILPSLDAGTDIFNPLAVHDRDMRRFQAHLGLVGVLFAIQLLYLSYGIWRIWRSSRWGRRTRLAPSLPSVQS